VAYLVDGNVVDIVTLCVGTVAVFVRPVRRGWKGLKPAFTRRACVVDFLNGATLVPFLLLIGSVISSELLQEALKAKLSMGLAGGVGVFFILGELLSGDSAA
jgi:hypothetical protein